MTPDLIIASMFGTSAILVLLSIVNVLATLIFCGVLYSDFKEIENRLSDQGNSLTEIEAKLGILSANIARNFSDIIGRFVDLENPDEH